MSEKTKRELYRFSELEDIILLREVREENPFIGGNWDEISLNVTALTRKRHTARSCKERSELLIKKFLSPVEVIRKQSGTEAQKKEKQELLAEIIQMRKDVTNCNINQKYKKIRLEKETEETIYDIPSIVDSNLLEVDNNNDVSIPPEVKSSPTKEPKKRASNDEAIEFLKFRKKMLADTAAYNKKKLELEERKVRVQEREITLREEKEKREAESDQRKDSLLVLLLERLTERSS